MIFIALVPPWTAGVIVLGIALLMAWAAHIGNSDDEL